MSSSVSWQRYDDEFHVSGVLTEAARACVSAHPTDVKDFFSRYFREVAGGTSVKALHHNEVLSAAGETAITFTMELCVGPEVSVTTGDLLASADRGRDGEARASLAASEGATDAEGNSYSAIQTTCAAAVSKLLQLGYAEPQHEWDSALRAALSTSPLANGTSALQWVLSIMASLVVAKQRCMPLHQYIAALIDDRRSGGPAVRGAHSTPARTGVSAASTARAGSDTSARSYSVPQLLVTFLVRAARSDAPEAVHSVRFSHVYVALDVLTSSVGDASGVEKSMPVSGAVLRQRMQKVRRAAQRFVQSHPTSSSVGTGGTLHWDGAVNLTDVVKAVTEALSGAQLNVGAEVCLGLSMKASTTRVPAANTADGGAAKDAPGECRVLYSLFGGGEPPVTGDQLSEYVKEQLKEVGPDIVQFLEDTHVMEDCVARQRLQMALQDSIVLSDVVAGQREAGSAASGLASPLPVQAHDGAFPNSVMSPCDCGTVSDVVDYVCATGEDSRRAVTVLVSTAAGDPQTAAHVVDLAIAGGASYVLVSAGIFSAHTAAAVSRLATRTDELTSMQMVAPRPSAQRFNRYDWPPLPTAEVAPIRRKGDKKKKDIGKANSRRK
ncbi:putative enolase [Leishmania major strain Friedlin]|uniref:Putative enolase n=1 Tax=Leishmania major TaxID=5664 RepID=Q4Q4P6_LEIMA|nr:putative enolase [Leishmania major strain Friedlin]CAG9580526.1 enolase_-_putative [Leishmania major strain Friedlin]CAJ08907.1 putative enolase [Leishmania major strain Friedlin]|eukprot:XP_001685702.1 putative enolase [Leishmania major strain Friedlin]